MNIRATITGVLLLAIVPCAAPADEPRQPTPSADVPVQAYDDHVRPFLAQHCIGCHSGEKPKKNLDLEQLAADFANQPTQKRWLTVLERIESGEMPPKSKPRPTDDEIRNVAEWIRGKSAGAAALRRSAEGRVVQRRLNRVEYENTIRGLLEIEINLKEMLPMDTSADGFDNSSEALHVSSFLMERYLEAADAALAVAIANGPRPPLVNKRFSCKDERYVKNATEKVFLHRDDELVCFSSSAWNAITTGQFYPPDRGKYRIRISASGYQSGGTPVTLQVDAGPMLMGQKNHLVGYFDVAVNEPTIVEFIDHFEARHTIRLLPYGLASAQTVNRIGADQYEGPGLAIQWVEVEGPLHDSWPPASHRQIFGDLQQKSAPIYNQRNRVEVVSESPAKDAQRILCDFTRRAFRRAVSDSDVQPFIEVFEAKQGEGYSFEQAMRVALKGILVSPDFLFLREQPGKLDDFALASRLSYFLWSTMPDEELLQLASERQLGDPQILRAQVERLLTNLKAAAFIENFVGQWLGLRDIDFTEPDRRLYPEFDGLLKESMVKETHLFFEELLKRDLSVAHLVASDFTLLNERLARHYGIGGVEGHAFRKVELSPDSHRGGVMTMASVLKVTANGTNTSPVVRGAWVLDRILGTPPAPPPAGVPAVEPDIRGATTIRQQLARHREIQSCAACHAKIDPPGFALESFDVIGGWRENYRSVGRGEPVSIDGRRMPYQKGPKVDPADTLADGRPFTNIDELKQLLLADKDLLARALTTKLLTYATGRAPEAADHAQIDAIVAKARDKGYGLRSLIHEVVFSDLFQDK
jgi:mono/diheme cytochrome c family protein